MRGFLGGLLSMSCWVAGGVDAWAGCTPSPPRSWTKQESVGPDTPIHVGSSFGTASEQANRLRIRGPDGALIPVGAEALGVVVQLVPETPWPDGSITVEERAGYDAHGSRVKDPDAPRSAWFAMAELNVVDTSEPLSAPSDAEWSRTDGWGTAKVVAHVGAPEGARWIDLEIHGVGPIHRHSGVTIPRMMLRSAANGRCGEMGAVQRIGSDGDVTARFVAYGDGGAVAAGPWTLLGPEGGDPVGRPSDTSRLQSWTPIPRTVDDAPVVTARGSCPSLELVSTVERKVSRGTALIRDRTGGVHEVKPGAPVVIDGVAIVGLEGRPFSIATIGERMFVSTVDRVVGIEDGVLVAEHAVGGSLEVDGEEIYVGTIEDAGRRILQRFDLELEPIGEKNEQLHPIDLRILGRDVSINGIPIEAQNVRDAFAGVDRVVLAHSERMPSGRRRSWLTVWSERGEPLRSMELPDGARAAAGRVDSDGVTVQYSLDRATHVVRFPPRSDEPVAVLVSESFFRSLPPEDRLRLGERTVVMTRDQWWVEDADGIASAPMTNAFGTAIEIEEGVVHVARLEYGDRNEPQVRVDRRYACSDDALGVPARWEGP